MLVDDYVKKGGDLGEISRKGQAIYEKIKNRYEPQENGKYLAIEVESGDAYLADDGALATVSARKEHPDKIVFLVKIGFDFAERFH